MKPVSLDALKRLCDGTDTWVGGESQVILPTSTVRTLIEIAEVAEAYQRAMRSAGQPDAVTTYEVMERWSALDGALDHLKRDQK